MKKIFMLCVVSSAVLYASEPENQDAIKALKEVVSWGDQLFAENAKTPVPQICFTIYQALLDGRKKQALNPQATTSSDLQASPTFQETLEKIQNVRKGIQGLTEKMQRTGAVWAQQEAELKEELDALEAKEQPLRIAYEQSKQKTLEEQQENDLQAMEKQWKEQHAEREAKKHAISAFGRHGYKQTGAFSTASEKDTTLATRQGTDVQKVSPEGMNIFKTACFYMVACMMIKVLFTNYAIHP